jgi:hypothetical protein
MWRPVRLSDGTTPVFCNPCGIRFTKKGGYRDPAAPGMRTAPVLGPDDKVSCWNTLMHRQLTKYVTVPCPGMGFLCRLARPL